MCVTLSTYVYVMYVMIARQMAVNWLPIDGRREASSYFFVFRFVSLENQEIAPIHDSNSLNFYIWDSLPSRFKLLTVRYRHVIHVCIRKYTDANIRIIFFWWRVCLRLLHLRTSLFFFFSSFFRKVKVENA